MKVIRFVFFTFFSGMIYGAPALAQYDDLRFPQPPGEIALFAKNNIMGETQWSLENDKKIAYFTRAFDRQGRIVISADYDHRKYYLYDDKSNLISYLDSARTDQGFKVSEYKFKYFDDGMLKEMTGPGMKSVFGFDSTTNLLIEKLTKNDTVYTNHYNYMLGKLHDAVFFDAHNKPVQHVMKNYDLKGHLFNETVAQKGTSFLDSSITIYEYNSKMQLQKTEKFRFMTEYLTLDKGSTKPDHSATHRDVVSTTFNLDNEGRPIAEEYSIKGDQLNYSYSTWKYDDKGLLIKDTYRVGKMEPRILEHEYVYF